jgi:hypothetical protein
MLNDDEIKEEMRRVIWVECTSMATFHDNILVDRDSGKPPHESMFKFEV